MRLATLDDGARSALDVLADAERIDLEELPGLVEPKACSSEPCSSGLARAGRARGAGRAPRPAARAPRPLAWLASAVPIETTALFSCFGVCRLARRRSVSLVLATSGSLAEGRASRRPARSDHRRPRAQSIANQRTSARGRIRRPRGSISSPVARRSHTKRLVTAVTSRCADGPSVARCEVTCFEMLSASGAARSTNKE